MSPWLSQVMHYLLSLTLYLAVALMCSCKKKMEAIVAGAKENKCFVVGENAPISSDSDLEEGFFPQPDLESPGQSLADMGSSAFHSPYAMCLMMQNEQEKAMEEDRTESSNNFCTANKLVREHL